MFQSMASQPVGFLIARLGITETHSRPHVSNHNPSSESPFIGRQQYTIDGQGGIGPKGCAQASRVIVHTRPLPLLGAFDEPGPHWVEVNVFQILVLSLNAWQSAVEKSPLPEKAPLSSARIDA